MRWFSSPWCTLPIELSGPGGRPARSHARPVEEHLVEVDLAAEVAEGANLDARLVQVEQEVRDALALRGVGIGTREQHRDVGTVRPRGPHLLPGDEPLVTVADRRGRER